LRVRGTFASLDLAEDLLQARPALRGEHLVEGTTLDLLPLVAVQLSGGVVPVHDRAEGVNDDDRGQLAVEQQGIVALRDQQPGLEILDVGDVLELAGVAGDDPFGIAHDPGAVQHPLHPPGARVEVRLEVVDLVALQQPDELVLQVFLVDVMVPNVLDLPVLLALQETVEGRIGREDVALQVGREQGVPKVAEQRLVAF
jgi:hypothetical protein